MRNSVIFGCLTALVVLVAGKCYAADYRTVVVVSIDALHPDALTEENAPLTMKMLEKGSLTRRGVSTSPPKTLIAHSAMMTGIGPDQGGRMSNVWKPGEPKVQGRTIFHQAKERGYRTGYFYSKPKLGYLIVDEVDEAGLTNDAPYEATEFLAQGGRIFVFIHVSGLDIVGPDAGWLSKPYLEELYYIDDYLGDVYAYLKRTGSYLLVITSDHGGHGRDHGGDHPDEARLPFGVVSDVCVFPGVEDVEYSVTQLPEFLERAFGCEGE